jgi:protein-tyrosine phosphatase
MAHEAHLDVLFTSWCALAARNFSDLIADMEPVRILFVCLGNICRSPTAEAVFRTIAAREAPDLTIEIDSAGTAGYHIGEPPDRRAQEAARRRGYDMSNLRARIVDPADFERFDFILAMDNSNLSTLRARAGRTARDRIRLFLEFAPDANTPEVPDPYYGGETGFEEVLDLVEAASLGLLRHLRERARAA